MRIGCRSDNELSCDERGMKDYSRTELTEAIDEWIVGRNAQRDRQVLKDRLIDGITFEVLAEKHEIQRLADRMEQM